MKKKLYLTRAVKLLCFALAVILLSYLLQAFVLKRNDHNTLRMDGFYLEDKDSLDVVLIGASDVYAGYSAAYAYEKYGVTSYPYATQSAPADVALAQLREVRKYQDPKLIIIELNAFLYADTSLNSDVHQRHFVDNIPLDEIKREYIETHVADDQKAEYYFPLIKFHGSWTDYPWKFKNMIGDVQQRVRGYSVMRGYKTVAAIYHEKNPVANDKLPDNDSSYPLGVNGERNLREVLDYLKENRIDNVVFMRFPHIVSKRSATRYRRLNEAQRIIEEEYGFDCVNLERYSVDAGFDVNADFYNWDHLNIYGAQKLTDYVCTMALDTYGVTPAQLSEKQQAEWEDSVAFYHKLYAYCDYLITNNIMIEDEDGESGITLQEDAESMEKIEAFAKEHPELIQ